jgi:hypothetical protein
LRTMNPSEVFNASLKVYRQLGWTYLRLTLVSSTFCLAGIAFDLNYAYPSLLVTSHAGNAGAQLGEAATALALALFVGGPLFLIGCGYTCAVVIQLTSNYMLGRPLDTDQAVQGARSVFGKLVGVALRELVIASGGIILGAGVMGLGALLSSGHQASASGAWLFGIGSLGIALGFCGFVAVVATHSLAPAILLIERLSASQAAKRSAYLLKAQLTHPSGLPTFFVTLFILFFAGVLEWASISIILGVLEVGQHVDGFLTGIPFAGVLVSAFRLLPPFVAVWTLLPIYATCVTLMYYERRIRLEGWDIETLAAETVRTDTANRFDV